MEALKSVISSDWYIVLSFSLNIILLIVVLIMIKLLMNTRREYTRFMKKLGNGDNLNEMLKMYLEDVREIKKDNEEIKNYYIKLDRDIASCIQKTGMVRYNAFKDVGSDLSFAIALLDRDNNGVVLNGLYGSSSSNIFAKPIKGGLSSYQLSDEEKYAIDIAEQNKNFYAKSRNNL
jgi:DNA repair exonuclease SbcCD ATPase subunit